MIGYGFKFQIATISVCYLLALFSIRGLLSCIKGYMLNKSAYKKRKKGETFKEWFLYSRYRTEMPKPLIKLYFTIMIVHPVAAILCITCNAVTGLRIYGEKLMWAVIFFDIGWNVLIEILFWKKGRNNYNYERWMHRRGGNRKRKKRRH